MSEPKEFGPLESTVHQIRGFYGNRINATNVFMPLSHYIPLAMQIQANLMTYRGVKNSKWPCDAWVYQEIIHARNPSVIIEIGNQHGASTMMFMDYLTMYSDKPKCVIGVDIDHSQLYERARGYAGIIWVEGDAVRQETVDEVAALLREDDEVMVIDDSNHEPEHTYQVLKRWSELASVGQYCIVEDTILGTVVPKQHREYGADTAVRRFMQETDKFAIDGNQEKWFYTNNPGGFLVRIR